MDISSTVAASFDTKNKPDWDRFIKTGEMKEQERFEIPMTPLIQYHIDRIRKNNGRLVFEDN